MKLKDFIIKNYDNMTYQQMADKRGLSFYRIAKEVGLVIASGEVKRKNKMWSNIDDNYLIDNYKTLDKNVIAQKLETTKGNVMDRYFKLMNGYIGNNEKRNAKQIIKDKKEEEKINRMYAAVMSRTEPNEGLSIKDLNLKLGQVYKIKLPIRSTNETAPNKFIGKLEQICSNHLVFRNKKGYCESFLKVDLLLENEYSEVN